MDKTGHPTGQKREASKTPQRTTNYFNEQLTPDAPDYFPSCTSKKLKGQEMQKGAPFIIFRHGWYMHFLKKQISGFALFLGEMQNFSEAKQFCFDFGRPLY